MLNEIKFVQTKSEIGSLISPLFFFKSTLDRLSDVTCLLNSFRSTFTEVWLLRLVEN